MTRSIVSGKTWQPLPWQRERWTRTLDAVAQGRLAHALLLAGPRGVGKGHFALGLASYLLCEASPDKPCGDCRSCIQIGAQVHPNLMRLAPAEDKRDIAIDDVRALLERLHLSSHYGQAKVAIVEPADALNASGANALLKTVEEPPAATHLLFVSERWRALPATLRSRCQILRFAPPAPAEALAWLGARHPDRPEAALRPFARAPLLVPARDAAADDGADWGRALADAIEGRLDGLRLAQGVKGDGAREQARTALEAWLRIGTGWLRALAVPAAADAKMRVPRGTTVAIVQRLLDDAVEALQVLDRAQPALLLESIMIRLSQPAASTARPGR